MKLNKLCFCIFLVTLLILNFSILYAINDNNNNISNYFRIHVVANSDSIDDQLLKYNIAKKLNIYINNLTLNCSTKEESKKTIENNIDKILTICHNEIVHNGSNYTVKAYIGKFKYDKKESYAFNMKAGIYDSLKIVIGNGNGQNWWSLIYPNNYLENIQNGDSKIEFSFGILEFFEKLFN